MGVEKIACVKEIVNHKDTKNTKKANRIQKPEARMEKAHNSQVIKALSIKVFRNQKPEQIAELF